MEKIEVFILAALFVAAVLAVLVINQVNTGLAISTTYTRTSAGQGIVVPYPGPTKDVQVPFSEIQLLGSRIPAFVILGDTNMAYISKCRSELIWDAKITSPKSRFNCFVIPVNDNKYYYDVRSPTNPWDGTGPRGDVFCYARTTGAESQGIDSEKAVRDKIMTVLVDGESAWHTIPVVNSLGTRAEVPVCATEDRFGNV